MISMENITISDMDFPRNNGQVKLPCWRYSPEGWNRMEVMASEEFPLQIFVNGTELVTILCTPVKLNYLVAGFLYNEGIIENLKDVATMRVCEDDFIADVHLIKPGYKPPSKRILTSGCGGGASYIEGKGNLTKVNTSLLIDADIILLFMKQLYQNSDLHQQGGGVHASALCNREKLLLLAEDIGRHNTLDKLAGECLFRNITTSDLVLLTTGRISSEMILKAVRMKVPIVASRSAPLTRSVSLATQLGITVIGYARGNHLEVYSNTERITGALSLNNVSRKEASHVS
ncbi:MAG: formate dehydrogenase accessory sulfurtransferase FdhD [Dehalococcoidia bacterium]|nr:formate dehydrogenase accessory sulfurtransferase FdhD [Dehalococcoidia bacterium]MDZ4246979.1 formate dehydrogenase accessory sulfurtransferase FdhD [Dehalococcoidia bacterium]